MKYLTTKNIITGGLLIIAAMYLVNAIHWITYPYQLDYGEGFVLYQSKLWNDGMWTWDIQQGAPYMVLAYAPLYPVISSALTSVFGATLLWGRTTMFIMTLGCLGIMFLTAKHLTKNYWFALVASLLPLLSFLIKDWSVQARPVDMFGLFFAMCGLYTAIRFDKSWKVLWSIPLFLIALFIKQSLIAFPIAVIIYLLIKQWRVGLTYAGTMGTLGITGLAIGQYLTGGQLINHMFTYLEEDPPFWKFGLITEHLSKGYGLITILVIVAFIYLVAQWRKKNFTLPTIALAVSLVINIPSFFRMHGYINYGLESTMMICLVCTLALQEYWNIKGHIVKYFIVTQIVLTMLIYPFYHLFPMPDSNYAASVEKVEAIIQNTEKPILSMHSYLVMDTDKTLYFDLSMFASLINRGLWDKQVLLDDLKEGNIEYVILRNPHDVNGYLRLHNLWDIVETIEDYYSVAYHNSDEYCGLYQLCVYKYEGYHKLSFDTTLPKGEL